MSRTASRRGATKGISSAVFGSRTAMNLITCTPGARKSMRPWCGGRLNRGQPAKVGQHVCRHPAKLRLPRGDIGGPHGSLTHGSGRVGTLLIEMVQARSPRCMQVRSESVMRSP
jgi:hypothetical protein